MVSENKLIEVCSICTVYLHILKPH